MKAKLTEDEQFRQFLLKEDLRANLAWRRTRGIPRFARDEDLVRAWLEDRCMREYSPGTHDQSQTPLSELALDYWGWCQIHGEDDLDLSLFMRELRRLGLTIGDNEAFRTWSEHGRRGCTVPVYGVTLRPDEELYAMGLARS